jgi:hypothetical protein
VPPERAGTRHAVAGAGQIPPQFWVNRGKRSRPGFPQGVALRKIPASCSAPHSPVLCTREMPPRNSRPRCGQDIPPTTPVFSRRPGVRLGPCPERTSATEMVGMRCSPLRPPTARSGHEPWFREALRPRRMGQADGVGCRPIHSSPAGPSRDHLARAVWVQSLTILPAGCGDEARCSCAVAGACWMGFGQSAAFVPRPLLARRFRVNRGGRVIASGCQVCQEGQGESEADPIPPVWGPVTRRGLS